MGKKAVSVLGSRFSVLGSRFSAVLGCSGVESKVLCTLRIPIHGRLECFPCASPVFVGKLTRLEVGSYGIQATGFQVPVASSTWKRPNAFSRLDLPSPC